MVDAVKERDEKVDAAERREAAAELEQRLAQLPPNERGYYVRAERGNR